MQGDTALDEQPWLLEKNSQRQNEEYKKNSSYYTVEESIYYESKRVCCQVVCKDSYVTE